MNEGRAVELKNTSVAGLNGQGRGHGDVGGTILVVFKGQSCESERCCRVRGFGGVGGGGLVRSVMGSGGEEMDESRRLKQRLPHTL